MKMSTEKDDTLGISVKQNIDVEHTLAFLEKMSTKQQTVLTTDTYVQHGTYENN